MCGARLAGAHLRCADRVVNTLIGLILIRHLISAGPAHQFASHRCCLASGSTMSALTLRAPTALLASTSGRPAAPAANLSLGASSFHGAGLKTRQQLRTQRIQKVCAVEADSMTCTAQRMIL